MRILVTGGAGFLGSHLCQALVARGEQVVCLDNFYTGNKVNVNHLLNEPNFELLHHDVTSPLQIEVDQIYNFACPASPIHYQKDPVRTMKTSVLGAMNMLELAKLRLLKYTVTQKFILKMKIIGAESIPSVSDPATTKANVV